MARERLLNSARLSALLGDGGLDAIIASSPANLFYVSGTMIISHRPSSHRLEMAILSPRHDPTLIICQIEESLTRHDSWVHDIRPYVLFQTKPMDLMAQVIREKGFARGRLGIEKRYIRAEYLAELARALPEARIDGCDDLFDRARAVKTPGEIRRLTDAAVATETAIERSLAATRLGCTERELAERLSVQVAELGADDSYHVVAAGDRTAFPFNRAGLAALEPGDLVRVQSIGSFDGYAAVATRLAVVGEPSTSQCDTYSRVCEIQEAVKQVHVDPSIARYIVSIVQATRDHPEVYLGSS
ncbi:MAG: aminopeptidase P family protein, partial [Armatimonadetes bacterium]|nr:aminopeptidase P family protein [Armatimonadota bacterium]